MSEPVNPLFEEEKAFLERKKLEYERALRGDLAQIKEQASNAGRVALVGGGLAGSIWLITKLFSGRKRRKAAPDFVDYDQPAGRDYYGQRFADFDDDELTSDHDTSRWQNTDDYFGSGGAADEAGQGAVYHTDSSSYDDPSAADDDLDDNGLHDYPDFPEHSSPRHGADAGEQAEHFESEAYGHPESTLPFDDSRRLPGSEEFEANASPLSPRKPTASPLSPPRHTEPGDTLGSMLLGLAKSSIGKVVVGQAASLAIGLATKVIKDKLTSAVAETPKSADLADLTGSTDGYAHGHPATPQPDAYPAPDAHSPDYTA